MSDFYEISNPSEMPHGFNQVIGLDDAKKAISECIIDPVNHSDFSSKEFIKHRQIMIVGPKACGKTFFAKAIAKEIGHPIVTVNLSNLFSCYIGQTEGNISQMIDELQEYASANDCGLTLLFDEIDIIAPKDQNDFYHQSIANAFAEELKDLLKNEKIVIISTTEDASRIVEKVSNLFPAKLILSLPNFQLREAFFRKNLAFLKPAELERIDITALAEASEGYSGHSIILACEDFLFLVSSVRAGIRSCDNFTEALLEIIKRK